MNSVIDYYNGFGEREWSRLDREPLDFLVNLHYINLYLPKNGYVLDNGAGPGKYSMLLAEKGFRLTLTDLTPKLVDIAKEKACELGVTENFDGFHVADASHLSIFQDGRIDATLMLGPLYHLQTDRAV